MDRKQPTLTGASSSATVLLTLAVTSMLLLAVDSFARQAVLPQQDDALHEGVASCATSVCHGRVGADPDSTVWLNEYRIWLRQDYHSRAYRTLQSEQSQNIARKLGLSSAAAAPICLDCHADNVPAVNRGRRFQLSDGVGCEACHGGAGRWLESHAEEGTSHSDNVARGMYPTEMPDARARLCLSCHLGTRDKFATHRIMGAGHPRLSFELETFTVNQPMHYAEDLDYRDRKPARGAVNRWLTGLAVTGIQSLELLQESWFTDPSLVPELSFFQCHGCHHPMDDLRWQPEGNAASLPPGAARLNDANLQILAVVLEVLAPTSATDLIAGIGALHQSSLLGREAVVAQVRVLLEQLRAVGPRLSDADLVDTQIHALRRALLRHAAAGKFRYFTAAEQAFLAVETLSLELDDAQQHQSQLDAWFSSVEHENQFVPQQFAVLAGKLEASL